MQMVFNVPPNQTNKFKASSFVSDAAIFLAGVLLTLLLVWSFWSFVNPSPNPVLSFSPSSVPPRTVTVSCGGSPGGAKSASDTTTGLVDDPPDLTFYDDPEASYSIEKPIKNWDEKRKRWLELHPSFAAGAGERILLVTGSQPSPCPNPIGDHFLLRFFKNKVDYCRIHGYDIFYNNALLHPKMRDYWAKYPIIRAAMMAHPEAEWIWWVDSDAAFTDMDFKLPLAKYKQHNLVVHGLPYRIYEKKSWVGLNAGIFLIRNCQWSMDLIDRWASMGPQSPDFDKWGEIQRSIFKDKLFPQADDQTALIYLLVEEREKWGDKIYIENEYYLHGYWVDIVGTYDNVTQGHAEVGNTVLRLRRRHAEKMSESYAALWETYVKGGSGSGRLKRRPFITHFVGCSPCSGDHNKIYGGDSCRDGMVRALNFADNQVLRNFGYTRVDLLNPLVTLLPSDFPA